MIHVHAAQAKSTSSAVVETKGTKAFRMALYGDYYRLIMSTITFMAMVDFFVIAASQVVIMFA